MKQLTFSTGNISKYKSATTVLNEYGINIVQNTQDIDEIQGEDAVKIVKDKVGKAYELIQTPVLVTDDSWEIPGLGGFPGPYMKSMNHWFSPQDFINLTISLEDRRVFLMSYLAYHDGENIKVFHQRKEGFLLKEIHGFNPIAPNDSVFSMLGDNGLSIAEYHAQELPRNTRETAQIWHDFAKWYKKL